MNETKEIIKRNKGITLVALVITIIVLLILAGVTIAAIGGENGILTRTKDGKTKHLVGQAREEIILAISSAKAEVESQNERTTFKEALKREFEKEELRENKSDIETATTVVTGVNRGVYKYTIDLVTGEITSEKEVDGGNAPIPEDPEVPIAKEWYEKQTGEENKEYTDPDGEKAIVPIDFAIVPGCEDISEGLVISDVANDTIDQGNQFVWIPVSKENFETEFIRREGFKSGSLQSNLSNSGEANGIGVNQYLEDNNIKEDETTKTEAKSMYASVKANGGFYIGRYEAGINEETERTNTSGIEDRVVVKKGKNVYNYIGWNNDGNMNTVEGGAVEKARGFARAQSYDTEKVHSTLCYSVQWDTALKFIEPSWDGYVKDSTGRGNYNEVANTNEWKGNLAKTGASENYKAKNIYDMAGNVWEWTMEVSGTNVRVCRGGIYGLTGFSYPVSYRSYHDPGSGSAGLGFRLALYL